MRQGGINTHNPLAAPDSHGYIELAPGYVKEVLEAYDSWASNEEVPAKMKELIMIFRIELSRRYQT